jgi:hypothetical protein
MVSYFYVGFLKMALKSTAFFFYPVILMLLIFVFFPEFSPINVTVNPSYDVNSLSLTVWKKASILKSNSGSFENKYSLDLVGKTKSVRMAFF